MLLNPQNTAHLSANAFYLYKHKLQNASVLGK